MKLVCCEPHPSEKVAERASYVCPGAWGTEGTVCQSRQRNLKGKKRADTASGSEWRTVVGKELFPSASGGLWN